MDAVARRPLVARERPDGRDAAGEQRGRDHLSNNSGITTRFPDRMLRDPEDTRSGAPHGPGLRAAPRGAQGCKACAEPRLLGILLIPASAGGLMGREVSPMPVSSTALACIQEISD